jgi:hypothetical protein
MPAPSPAGGDVTVAPSVEEAPTTLTAFPETATGALADGAAWLPPVAEPEPSVVERVPWVPAGAALRDRVLDALPVTEMALPLACTGVLAAGAVWLPPPVEFEPVVEPELPEEPVPLDPPAVLPLLDESPSTDTEFPLAATGAVAAGDAWLPPTVLLVPVVSSAEACPAKNRNPPPAIRAVNSPRLTYLCIGTSFLS